MLVLDRLPDPRSPATIPHPLVDLDDAYDAVVAYDFVPSYRRHPSFLADDLAAVVATFVAGDLIAAEMDLKVAAAVDGDDDVVVDGCGIDFRYLV